MLYRIWYFEYVHHDGQEYKELKTKTVSDYKDFLKRNIYFLTDINGNVIIDNREREV